MPTGHRRDRTSRRCFVIAVLCAAGCGESVDGPPLELVASWRFDEGSGTTAADSSPLHADCTLSASASWTLGPSGSALAFDGSSESVTCGPDPLATAADSMTIALWARFDALTTYEYLVEGSWFYVFHRGDFTGPFVFFVAATDNPDQLGDSEWSNAAAVRTTTGMALGEWFHLIGTLEGDIMSMYVNGRLEKQISCVGCFNVVAGNPTPVRFGDHVQGAIDEVELFSRAMTASDARHYYEQR